MTNLQEDLTLALRRRAEAVTVESNLDAILEDDRIIRFSNDRGANPRQGRVLVVAASVVLLVGAGGLIWANGTRTEPPEASSATPAPADDTMAATTEPVTAGTMIDPPSGSTAAPTSAAPGTFTAPLLGCGDGGQTSVPNVAGLPYPEAVTALLASGLSFEVMREVSPEGETASDDAYAVVAQDVQPGATVACGAVVQITAAYRPGKLYTVQSGDTWESIAAAQGIPVEELLEFSGFSVAELEAAGETIATPLEVGRAIALSIRQPWVDTAPVSTG